MDVGLNSGQLALPGNYLLFERRDTPAPTVHGGTSASQANVIAERVFGLPKG
jgi:acyl-coenzyme A thioesterase PaaI-like protein